MALPFTDGKPAYAKPYAHNIPFPSIFLTGEGQVTDATSGLNSPLSKRRGACYLMYEGVGIQLLVQTGSLATDAWEYVDGSGTQLVPVGSPPQHPNGSQFSDSKPVTPQTTVGGLEFPIVSATELSDTTHPINNTHLSGKKRGATCLVYNEVVWRLFWATGSAPTDQWRHIAESSVTITPSGTGLPVDGVKPVAYDMELACVHFEVYSDLITDGVHLQGDIDDAADPINAGDGVSNGKQLGSLVLWTSGVDSSMRLYWAGGSEATSFWYPVGGSGDIVTPS